MLTFHHSLSHLYSVPLVVLRAVDLLAFDQLHGTVSRRKKNSVSRKHKIKKNALKLNVYELLPTRLFRCPRDHIILMLVHGGPMAMIPLSTLVTSLTGCRYNIIAAEFDRQGKSWRIGVQ